MYFNEANTNSTVFCSYFTNLSLTLKNGLIKIVDSLDLFGILKGRFGRRD